MNSLHKICLFLALFVLSFSVNAQQKYTIIHKNVNSTASGLKHDLNRVGDTIVMSSDKSILRVSFLSHAEKETVMVDLDNNQAKIPLYNLPLGRYTIAVYREDMIIAFDIVREAPITLPEDAVTDLEESIWRSSLSDEELVKRNLKPLPNDDERDTRLASATSKPSREKQEQERIERERSERERIKKEHEALLEKERALAEANLRKIEEERLAKQKEQDQRLAEAKKEAEEARKKALKREEELRIAEVRRKELREEEEKRKLAEAQQKEIEASKKQMLAEVAQKKELEAQKAKEDALTDDTKSRDKNATAYDRKATVVEQNTEVKEVKYNLSIVDDKTVDKQSREEYRKENLRPNGKPYDD